MREASEPHERSSAKVLRVVARLFRRCGGWLWKALELSPEAMVYADPLFLSPAFSAVLALEAEARASVVDAGGAEPVHPRLPRADRR